jgi:hypothetical protein
MQLKCSSCGASQEILNIQNCNFCGSIINPEIKYTNNSIIIFEKNNSKITLHEKSLEYYANENQFLVLLKNIQILKSSVFNINKITNPIYWQSTLAITIVIFCYGFYNTLIPHKIDTSFTAYGSTIKAYEQSEPSLGVFIIFFLFCVLPFLILTYKLKITHDNSKTIFVNDDEHFIQIVVSGVTPKDIKIGTREETTKVYQLIKEKIEIEKMRHE